MGLSVSVKVNRPRVRDRGVEPLSPQRKWRAITIATLVLVPAFWSMLAGTVSIATGTPQGAPNPAAALAFGFALIPFVFIGLAFLSEHPTAPAAAARAMGVSVLVGIVVSAFAADAVTRIVAGVGAGGICALRADDDHTTKARVLAVVAAAAYAFVLVRVAGPITLLAAPVFPFTALGLADHFAERRAEA
jgi:hypothetical protein